MKANRLANDGIRSGWFITTTVALSRCKWAWLEGEHMFPPMCCGEPLKLPSWQ
jgi:hypothetical protein